MWSSLEWAASRTLPEYARDLLMTLSLALHYGRPVVLLGEGLGPLEDPGLRELASCVLRRVDMIALREDVTGVPLLRSLKVPPERVITTGDDAIELAYRERSALLGSGIGINIRASEYAAVDREFISGCGSCSRKHFVLLMRSPTRSDFQRTGEADIETFRSLVGSFECTSASLPKFDMPLAIIRQLANCRILVCGSYHAAVFACSSGIPAVCLAKSEYYHAKFRGLTNLFGEGCELVSLDDPDFEPRLREVIHKCWKHAEQLRPRLIERAEAQLHSVAPRTKGSMTLSPRALIARTTG